MPDTRKMVSEVSVAVLPFDRETVPLVNSDLNLPVRS